MATIDLLTPDFWDSCNQCKSLVVDAPARKMAIYANSTGQIVLSAIDGDDALITEIDSREVLPMVKMLFKALLDAEPIAEKCHQEYLDYEKLLAAEHLIDSRIKNVRIAAKD